MVFRFLAIAQKFSTCKTHTMASSSEETSLKCTDNTFINAIFIFIVSNKLTLTWSTAMDMATGAVAYIATWELDLTTRFDQIGRKLTLQINGHALNFQLFQWQLSLQQHKFIFMLGKTTGRWEVSISRALSNRWIHAYKHKLMRMHIAHNKSCLNKLNNTDEKKWTK